MARLIQTLYKTTEAKPKVMTSRTLTDAGGKTISIVDVGGFLMPKGIVATSPEQTKAFFDSVPDFRLRDDDIMMLSYPKTGENTFTLSNSLK